MALKGFDLSTWSGRGGYALNSAAQAGMQAGAQTLVNGSSFQDNLEGALTSQAYSTLQALSFHAVGDYAEGKWGDGSPEKIALHATVGGLLSKAMGGDFATGAAAAGANEALIEHLSNGLGLDNTTDRGRELEQAASQLIGLVAAGLVEGELQQGSDIAKNATAFNRQLDHKDKELAKKRAEESNGRYSVEELEAMLRLSERRDEGIYANNDMVSNKDDIYDLGGEWIKGGNDKFVQLLPEANPEIINYLMGDAEGYTWHDSMLGLSPGQGSQDSPISSWPITSGDAPLFVQKSRDGKEYSLALSSLDSLSKGDVSLEMGIKSNPGHYGLQAVEHNGGIYYVGVSVGSHQTYVNKENELLLSDLGSYSNYAKAAFPPAAPVLGFIDIGLTLGEVYYSDDRLGTIGRVGVSKFFGWAGSNLAFKYGSSSSNTDVRLDAIGSEYGGKFFDQVYD